MLPLLLAASLAAAQVPDSAHVVLVATTDVHGRTTGWDYVARRPSAGGLARVAPVVDSLRRRYPGQVVLLDAGDLLQGDPFATYHGRVAPATPHPIVEAMNLVGYDAATPGNHDFDFGVPAFERAVADAAFPYVSANIYAASGDTLIFPAVRVLQRQGIRVGVAGFTTPGTMVWNRDRLRGRLRVGPIGQSAGATLATLRQVSDLSVVLMHSGMDGPATYDTAGVGDENVAASLASLPFRPDVVVVGHSHGELADSVVNGVHFVQPRHHAAGVAVVHVDLRRVGGRWGVARIRAESVPVGDRAPAPLLTQRLAASHAATRDWVDEAIGEAPAPLRATDARARPTPLHDFVLETLRRRARADLASGPVFDPRAGFDADTIRRGHVLSLYPYDNTLRAVRISGAQLKAYLEWSARYFRTDAAGRVSIDDAVPGYDFDLVRGARYDIDLRRPVGDRIRSLAVRGRPVAPSDSFTLALNSHRQAGSGGYTMLRGAPVVYDRDENIADLLVEEIRSRRVLDPAGQAASEWRIVPEVAAMAVRRLFGVAPDPAPPSRRDTVLLRILGTADLHGDLLRQVPALERAMDSLGAVCDCPTLRVDAGDALQGGLLANATAGRASVAALDRLGYAAAVPGDRDFDWSSDTLRRRIADSGRLWVAANLFDSTTGRRPDWIAPYGLVEAAGLRIAVIGYITPDTKAAQPAERTRGLRFGTGRLVLHEVLAEVRAMRADLTLLLAHERAACDSMVCDGELIRLAEQLDGSGVDLVIAGHSGQIVDARVGGITVVAPDGGGSLAVVDVVRTVAGGRALRARVERIGAADAGASAAPLAPLERRADSLARRAVAQLKRPLGRENGLGAMVAEARRNAARADLGLVRPASLAADLPAGPVTYARLAQVEPGAADLVVVRLSGAQLRDLLEQAVAGPAGPGAHLAGATVRFDPGGRPGRRIKSIALTGGRKFRPGETYSLATDDATAAGAGGLETLRGRPAERRGMIDVEAVAAYLRRLPQPVEIRGAA
ncbi:MAG TPA: 5'-nucleotidase C-terminal domain-containing protein, partial [Gemmatimonadales bacterium]|nr:5'-nucleotidase C-terminal domain-containing protein [Gemmatimonadales bacterium]